MQNYLNKMLYPDDINKTMTPFYNPYKDYKKYEHNKTNPFNNFSNVYNGSIPSNYIPKFNDGAPSKYDIYKLNYPYRPNFNKYFQEDGRDMNLENSSGKDDELSYINKISSYYKPAYGEEYKDNDYSYKESFSNDPSSRIVEDSYQNNHKYIPTRFDRLTSSPAEVKPLLNKQLYCMSFKLTKGVTRQNFKGVINEDNLYPVNIRITKSAYCDDGNWNKIKNFMAYDDEILKYPKIAQYYEPYYVGEAFFPYHHFIIAKGFKSPFKKYKTVNRFYLPKNNY